MTFQAKQAVVVTARVHPGETNGSWMMKGFLDFVTGNSTDAKALLRSPKRDYDVSIESLCADFAR